MSYKIDMKTAVAICLGAIIGDTLFVVTGIPIAQDGVFSLLGYVVVGIVAMLVAGNLGELSSMMPKAKGVAYSYASRAFGTELGFVTGILLYFGYCTTISAVSFGFAGYFLSVLGIAVSPAYQIAIAALLIISLSLLNMRGITETAKLNQSLILIILFTVSLFVAFALLHVAQGGPAAFHAIASSAPVSDFTEAITTIVFAYAGFQVLTGLTDNVRGKGVGTGKAMIYSIFISMVAFVLITIGVMLLVPNYSLDLNSQPLSTALNYVHAPQGISILIDIGILVAIATATLTLIFTASRLIYQIGSDGLLPQITRAFNKDTGVAVNGIWISAVVEIVMLFSGNIYTILSISNFGIIFSWIMACFALINMRRRQKHGSFMLPYYPYLSVIAIAGCLVFLFGLPRAVLALGVILILALLLVYSTIVELKYKSVPRVRLFE